MRSKRHLCSLFSCTRRVRAVLRGAFLPVSRWTCGASELSSTLYWRDTDTSITRVFRRIKAGRFKFHDEYWGEISVEAKVGETAVGGVCVALSLLGLQYGLLLR